MNPPFYIAVYHHEAFLAHAQLSVLAPGVNFINAGIKMTYFGISMSISNDQFHKTLLAFKTPKSSVYIPYIGILNAHNLSFKAEVLNHWDASRYWDLKKVHVGPKKLPNWYIYHSFDVTRDQKCT